MMLHKNSKLPYTRHITPKRVNEWRIPPTRRSAWATKLRTNVATVTVASRWRHCDDLADQAIEPHTSRTDRVGLATELIGRHNATQDCSKIILFV